MKRFLLIIGLGLILAASVMAADVQLNWTNPTQEAWDAVRIYRIVAGQYTLATEAPGTALSVVLQGLAPGEYVFVARAVAGGIESVDSNTATTTIKPTAPAELKILVTISQDGAVRAKVLP